MSEPETTVIHAGIEFRKWTCPKCGQEYEIGPMPDHYAVQCFCVTNPELKTTMPVQILTMRMPEK